MSHSGADMWMPSESDDPEYDQDQLDEIERLEADARAQLAPKPKRLAHSLSVARTAEHMALLYGVDPFLARCAGILHDWDKVVPHEELIRRAQSLGIDMGVDLHLVEPLLHGKVAALELADLYPELDPAVFQAIARHTTGASDMTPLDEVVFVADGIEPLRKASEGIERTRSLVGREPLDDVYWESFWGGMVYVIQTGRYLWPGTLSVYNDLAAARNGARR